MSTYATQSRDGGAAFPEPVDHLRSLLNRFLHLCAQHGSAPPRFWHAIEPRLESLEPHERQAALAAYARAGGSYAMAPAAPQAQLSLRTA